MSRSSLIVLFLLRCLLLAIALLAHYDDDDGDLGLQGNQAVSELAPDRSVHRIQGDTGSSSSESECPTPELKGGRNAGESSFPVSLHFETEDGRAVTLDAVTASGGAPNLRENLRAQDGGEWQGRLVAGSWDILAYQDGKRFPARFRLAISGPTRQTLRIVDQRVPVLLDIVSMTGELASGPFEIVVGCYRKGARALSLTSMADVMSAAPSLAARERLLKREFTLQVESPKVSMDASLGDLLFITVQTVDGRVGQGWLEVLDSTGEVKALVVGDPRRRCFQAVRIGKNTDVLSLAGSEVELLTAWGWARPSWRSTVSRGGKFYVGGYGPFLGGNHAILRAPSGTDGDPGLPIAVVDLPDAADAVWTSDETIEVAMRVGSDTWRLTASERPQERLDGASEEGRLEFHLSAIWTKGYRPFYSLGTMAATETLVLPSWVLRDDVLVYLHVPGIPPVELVVRRDARELSVPNTTRVAGQTVDLEGRPLSGVSVAYRSPEIDVGSGVTLLPTLTSDDQGAFELLTPENLQGTLEFRHPGFRYREVGCDTVAKSGIVKLAPLAFATLNVRSSSVPKSQISGTVVTSMRDGVFSSRHSGAAVRISHGESVLPLQDGPGLYRLRLWFPDLRLEASRKVRLEADNYTLGSGSAGERMIGILSGFTDSAIHV